nr:histidine kinase dimerization/phosphoacceptor domain -containing protein [Sphingomonas xinjiangensis]
MPTGAKVFLILLGALFPLALIAALTTVQTTRDAGSEARRRLEALAQESSGVLENVLANHVSQMSQALAALEENPQDAPSCMRLVGTFASQSGARFNIAGNRGQVLCGQRLSAPGGAPLAPFEVRASFTDKGLVLRIGGSDGASATAIYPATTLGGLVRPSGFVPEYGAWLIHGKDRLELRKLDWRGALGQSNKVDTSLSVDELALEMATPAAPITWPLILATALVFVMWVAAAAIAWFVVDRLLIRPLRRLRTGVGNYKPGESMDTKRLGSLPAQEIRELSETFRQIIQTVQVHEADLAEGLVRQTRLTREVHHRVKNNLQVIASLINFHARGAKSAEATEAYASIQRRVDALAVVHRHHYAEMEENRGLDLRAVVGELAANIRATAPERAMSMGITLDIEPLLVNQDVAIAVAFLITELVELAMSCNQAAQIRITMKGNDAADRATMRVSSPALVESPALDSMTEGRYGRIIAGLARQLRTKLHHDPLIGAYEADIAITGRP